MVSEQPDDEDSNPYQIDAPPEVPCPGCARGVPAAARLCPDCGFDLKTGKPKHARFEPVRRSWETGWPLRRRVRLFVIGQAAAIPLGLIGARLLDDWGAFVGPWLVFTALTAYLLGTFARTDLARFESGKVRLTLTWRVCFVPRAPQSIRRAVYEGVVCAKAPAADVWDYFVLVLLALYGIVPGVLWWYFMIRPDSFFVGLTRDHGVPDRTVYWGWDEVQAEEMARTLREVAFAPT